MKIWITWHREKYFNEKQIDYIKSRIENYVLQNSQNTFLVWWCNWIDNWFWESCIKNNVDFILYLPFWNWDQIEYWLSKDEFIQRINEQITRDKFNEKQVDQLYWIYLKSKNIKTFNWFKERDEAISDDCDQLYCWMLFEKWDNWIFSWTWFTVNRAKKLYWKIIINVLTWERIN